MHGHVHVEGRVVVVLVVVVVIVQGGHVLQRGHVGRRGQPRDDDGVVDPALRHRRVVVGARGDEQGGLYRLGSVGGHGQGVGMWGVLWGRTHTGPFGVFDGLRRRADPLP